MKYSELEQLFDDKRETYAEFSVHLVEPDLVEGDEVDVVLVTPRTLVIDQEKQQIRISSGAGQPGEREEMLGVFGVFIAALPIPGVLDGDYELLVQLPLAEEDIGVKPQQLVPLAGVHVGINSEEVWLLVRPAAEYPADVLPD